MYSHTQGSQLFLFEDAYWYTEVEEGQERSDKCTYTEQPERPSVQREPAGADGEAFRNRKGLSYESEGRDPVFIVVRCIAANRMAGTVYESINQSINQSTGQPTPERSFVDLQIKPQQWFTSPSDGLWANET